MIKSIDPLFELAITLPKHGSGSLLRSLHTQLRDAIVAGRLQADVRMPPTRKLSALHGVSRNTVVGAYDLLLSEGYLETRRGNGTFVTNLRSRQKRGPDGRVENPRASERDLSAHLSPFWRRSLLLMSERSAQKLTHNFRVGVPDKSLVPFDTWRRISARALRTLSKAPLDDGDPQGRLALRGAIAKHVSFTRAVACDGENVTVTGGAQQAFDLLARILVTFGKTVVVVEEPGYPMLRAAFASAGAIVVPVTVDEEGLVVDRIPKNASVICVSPSHQYPLGMAMSLRRRMDLLAFAQSSCAVIIEDDYDGEFRFGGRPLDALQTLDNAQSVFYVGTFSKSLFPALRLGYVIAPTWAHSALGIAKEIAIGDVGVLEQETLAAFIDEGYLARHVRKVRSVYDGRRSVLIDHLTTGLHNWLDLVPSQAGLHLTAYVKGRTNADTLSERASRVGVGVSSLSRYCTSKPLRGGLVFGYGAISERLITEGMTRLTSVLKRLG